MARVTDGVLEESPLLDNGDAERMHQARSPSLYQWKACAAWFKVHSAYMIVPIFFGTLFAAVVTCTTTTQIYGQVVCGWWLASHDPASLPSDGGLPSVEQCNIQSVKQTFSLIVTAEAVSNAVGGIIASGIINYFSTRNGRKPVMLVLMSLNVMSTICLLYVAGAGRGALQDGLLLAGTIIGGFSSPVSLSLMGNMYVTDMTEPHQRTFVLSVAEAFGAIGTTFAYWLGGYVSRRSGPVTVYWWKLTIGIAIILYVHLVLPESFSAEKREEARRAAEERRSRAVEERRSRVSGPRSPFRLVSLILRTSDVIGSVLEPLSLLKPSRTTTTGRPNSRPLRPLRIAISQAFVSLGGYYIGPAFIIYSSAQLKFNSDKLSIALSANAFARVICLSVVLPATLRWARPFYNERRYPQDSRSQMEEGASDFDIHIATASSILWAFAVLLMGLAPSPMAIDAALVLLAFSSGQGPSIKSIMTASVDPLLSGQVLSALAIVTSAADFIAPILFGAILSSTISECPKLVFFICSATIFVGAVLLFFVRGSDRYINSAGEE